MNKKSVFVWFFLLFLMVHNNILEIRAEEVTSIVEVGAEESDETAELFGPGMPSPVTIHQEISASKLSGDEVVSYAVQFVGNPYVYGGTSLTSGADCSGFVQSVYKSFNVSLPRTSGDQRYTGVEVANLENALPGDIITYQHHVGIYIGDNKIVHASSKQEGIIISRAAYKPILSIRRIL